MDRYSSHKGGSASFRDIEQESRKLVSVALVYGSEASPVLASLVYLTYVLNTDTRFAGQGFSNLDLADETIPTPIRLTLLFLRLRATDNSRMLDGVREVVAEACTRILEIHGQVGLTKLHELVTSEEVTKANMFQSPDEIAKLLANLAEPRGIVGDIACGYGGFLVEAASHGARLTSLVGFDIDVNAALVAHQKLSFLSVPSDVQIRNSLDFSKGESLDVVISQPPWGIHTMSEEVSEELRAFISELGLPVTSGYGDYLWLLQVIRMLKPGGSGVVLLPASGLRSRGIKGRLLRKLTAVGLIESVTSLPGGLFALTSTPTVILTVRSIFDALPGPVLLQDLSDAVEVTGPRRKRLDLSVAERAVSTVISLRHGRWSDRPGNEAKLVAADEIEKIGLHPQIHLDPPPQVELRHPEPPVRGLYEIRLSGYKAFVRDTNIPLAPLTLIFGANSAGKSSIMQSLHLLKQSVDSRALLASGPAINAGSFTSLMSAQTRGPLRIGVTFGAQRSWLTEFSNDVIANPALRRLVEFEFEQDSSGHESHLSAVKIGAGDTFSDLRQTDSGDYFHASIRNLIELVEMTNSEFYAYPQNSPRLSQGRTPRGDVSRSLQGVEEEKVGFSGEGLLPDGRLKLHYSLKQLWANNRGAHLISQLETLASTMGGIRAELEKLLESISYLGPFRRAPQRFYSAQESPQLDDGSYQFVSKLGLDTPALQSVNIWLRRLEIPYTVDVKRVKVEGDGSIDLGLLALTLLDHRSGALVTLPDVGYGLSQILPIIAELNSQQESLICIEQPETHLHPRLQARLADLFMESVDAAGRQNQLIVETHSEHLLLRIQRAIREGSFNAVDLKVLYVDQSQDEGAFVQDIELNSRGEFVVPWPGGFFDDRFGDLFSGLAPEAQDPTQGPDVFPEGE